MYTSMFGNGMALWARFITCHTVSTPFKGVKNVCLRENLWCQWIERDLFVIYNIYIIYKCIEISVCF